MRYSEAARKREGVKINDGMLAKGPYGRYARGRVHVCAGRGAVGADAVLEAHFMDER